MLGRMNPRQWSGHPQTLRDRRGVGTPLARGRPRRGTGRGPGRGGCGPGGRNRLGPRGGGSRDGAGGRPCGRLRSGRPCGRRRSGRPCRRRRSGRPCRRRRRGGAEQLRVRERYDDALRRTGLVHEALPNRGDVVVRVGDLPDGPGAVLLLVGGNHPHALLQDLPLPLLLCLPVLCWCLRPHLLPGGLRALLCDRGGTGDQKDSIRRELARQTVCNCRGAGGGGKGQV